LAVRKLPTEKQIQSVVRPLEKTFREAMGRQMKAVRRIGQLLAIGGPQLIESELEKELDAIDDVHQKIDKAFDSMIAKLRKLGVKNREINANTRRALADISEALGWGHAVRHLITGWAEHIEMTQTLTKLAKKLEKLKAKEEHGDIKRGGKEAPETMYR
jgi:hypothetical protein